MIQRFSPPFQDILTKVFKQITSIFMIYICYFLALLISYGEVLEIQSYILSKNKIMIKTKKFLRFEDMQLVATEEHPKDVSRALLRIIDVSNNNEKYKTFRYGTVEPMKISWDSQIQLPYLSQQSFRFETICEHQFGYQLQQLKAIYNGIIYIRPDQFFFQCSAHCFNEQGRQCGVLKYMIKVIEREEAKKKQQKVQTKQPVKVNLIAKVSIYSATLVVNSYYTQVFNKKKHRKLMLQIKYNNNHYIGQQKHENTEYKWNFSSKFEIHQNDPDEIFITINEDDHLYLKGSLHMATLQENKRFTVQIIPLFDQKEQNIASIHIDLRYISKKQLLDLMYSPKQLSDNKKDREEIKYFQFKKRTSSALGDLQPYKKISGLVHSRALSKQLQNGKISAAGRYKIALYTEKHESSIPRSKRFLEPKGVNQHISYLDPDLLSDFSTKRKQIRGATQSTTNKTDFTKLLKANPGVGQYHLPSIWEKK